MIMKFEREEANESMLFIIVINCLNQLQIM